MIKQRIAVKLILTNLVIIFVPMVALVVAGAAYYTRTTLAEQQGTDRYIAQGLASAADSAISAINEVSISIISSETIRAFCNAGQAEPAEQLGLYTKGVETLQSMRMQTVQDICLMTADGRYLRSGTGAGVYGFTDEEVALLTEQNGRWVWLMDRGRPAFCRLIRNIYNINETQAYLKIVLEPGAILRQAAGPYAAPEHIGYLLAGSDGTVLHHNLQGGALAEEAVKLLPAGQGTAALAAGGSDYIAYLYPLRDRNTSLVVVTADRSREFRQVLRWVVVLLFSFFGVLFLMQTLSYRHLVIAPITRLGRLMGSVESADFSVRYKTRSNDEIQDLANRFNLMTERLEHLYKEVYLSEIRVKEAEIESLQSQINPHFLYNTLDSIYWMIELGDSGSAAEMVRMLSSLFRISLHRTVDGLVPLHKELEHVRCYIRLQQLRYGDKFDCNVEVGPGLEGCAVLKLVLQPIVENAISHGLGKSGGYGQILVNIYREGETLVYYCFDSGGGADPAHIRRLLEGGAEGGGIALRNINDRIQLKYGPAFGIRCQRPPGGGSLFLVTQPILDTGGDAVVQADDCG